MTVELKKQTLVGVFNKVAPVNPFFSSMFATPRSNLIDSETVHMDFQSNDRRVSIAVPGIRSTARVHEMTQFVNKELPFVVHNDSFVLDAYQMFGRNPGVDPFRKTDNMATAIRRVRAETRMLLDAIRRANELYCSQILQTGIVNAVDAAGNTMYTVDFNLKPSHKLTAPVAWNNAAADIVSDLDNANTVVLNDSFESCNQAIFGRLAYKYFLENDAIKERLNFRRANTINVVPQRPVGAGAKFRGQIDLGETIVDILTYDGRYKDPQTGTVTPYMNEKLVIMRNSAARMDGFMGEVPRLGNPEGQVLRYLPQRVPNFQAGLYTHMNAKLTDNLMALEVEVMVRNAFQPTDRDSFAIIDTQIP